MSGSDGESGAVRMSFALQRSSFELDVDVNLPLRGITGIFGPSGSGKTTLLRCIAGLERAASAELIVDDDVWMSDAVNIPVHRRNVGYVFQEPRLFPHLNVRRNLEYGFRRRKSDGAYSVDEIVELLGLQSFLGRMPASLSGGEAQRVAIGRALLRSPRFILMDEPMAALDAKSKTEVLPFMQRLHEEIRVPILFVSHNIEEICLLCDQLLIMEQGRSLVHGPLQDVLMRTDLPVLAGDEAGSVLRATCSSYDAKYGLSELLVSAGRLWVPGRFDTATNLRLRLRANDLSLCRDRPSRTSILNTLPATIDKLQEENDSSVLVHLRANEDRLVSRITRRSVAELELRPGEAITLQIKSVSVRHS